MKRKKYTVYLQNKSYYNQFGWQGSLRKQSDDEELKKLIETYDTYTHAVYKVKDNETGEIIATNAE